MRQYSNSHDLSQRIGRCWRLRRPWAGVVFRSASVRYANRDDFLTGSGAKMAGARWNPPNSFATLYSSLDPETAVLEALAHHRYFRLPPEYALPRVLAAARVVLQSVLDLTDERVRRVLGVGRASLVSEDWRLANKKNREAVTQAIGRIAWEGEWESLLVPSAAHRGRTNLIVFPSNVLPPKSYVLILNREQLPPLQPT